MRENESPYILFTTTVLTHVTMIPLPYLFYKRRYVFEFCLSLFGLISSFMYHFCESFDTRFLLTEKQWHRLDNIGVIAVMGTWFVFISNIRNPLLEMCYKYTTLFLTIILQQPHPWDIRFTVAPILLFSLLPTVQHCFLQRSLPAVHVKYFCYGTIFTLLAMPFFILGMDDKNDTYRVYHGLWHCCGGFGSLFYWLMMKRSVVNYSRNGDRYRKRQLI